MTTEEKIDRLTDVVDSLAAAVVAHDNQIGAFIGIGEKQDRRLRNLPGTVSSVSDAAANTERQWQAYINTPPRR